MIKSKKIKEKKGLKIIVSIFSQPAMCLGKGMRLNMKKEEITLKNTKAEILDALNEALEREKSMSQVKYEPEKEEKKKR